MMELLNQLRTYGADVDGALDRFVGDEPLYAECFRLFLNDVNFTALDTALAENNLSAASEAAHTLKGVSGNLGLTPLYQDLCAIVEPLRRNKRVGVDGIYRRIQTRKAILEELVSLQKG